VVEAKQLISRWTLEDRPTLIILDLSLPDGDAAEVVKVAREANKRIPITILTGFPESYKVSKALSEGIVSLMRKPLTLEGLRELFETHSEIGRASCRERV